MGVFAPSLASLRGLLKARIGAGHRRNWPLFGEHNAAHDGYCRAELHAWLAEGAAIYICGSPEGMAGAVDSVLHALLGAVAVEALIEEDRYRRDVY